MVSDISAGSGLEAMVAYLAAAGESRDATSRVLAWSWRLKTVLGEEVWRGEGESGLRSAAATTSGDCAFIKCGEAIAVTGGVQAKIVAITTEIDLENCVQIKAQGGTCPCSWK